jgi:hypothetical protein
MDLRHSLQTVCDTCNYRVLTFARQLGALPYLRKLATTRGLERIVPRFFIPADVRACDCRNAMFVFVVLVNFAVRGNSIGCRHFVLISWKIIKQYADFWVFGGWFGSRDERILSAFYLCLLEFVVRCLMPAPLLVKPMVREKPRIGVSYAPLALDT